MLILEVGGWRLIRINIQCERKNVVLLPLKTKRKIWTRKA